jgi:endonuclease G
MMKRLTAAVLLAFILFAGGAAAAPFDDCREHLPFGVPSLTVAARTTPICHTGYAVLVDDARLVPRWVAYELKGENTFGCIARTNNFHADDALPKDRRAVPADYKKSGYDQGHHAPAQDFAWDMGRMRDSFSMANMAPQKHALNGAEWERLEETIRAWAWKRGELIVYVGSVWGERPKSIGVHHVAVPTAFWKVVVDPKKHEAIAFFMPYKPIPKGSLSPG